MRQWAIHETDTEDWDCWIIGTVEDGQFIEQCRTLDPKFAAFAKAAFEWFDAFEGGTVKPAIVPPVKAKKPRR
jgi:hypothetical protein